MSRVSDTARANGSDLLRPQICRTRPSVTGLPHIRCDGHLLIEDEPPVAGRAQPISLAAEFDQHLLPSLGEIFELHDLTIVFSLTWTSASTLAVVLVGQMGRGHIGEPLSGTSEGAVAAKSRQGTGDVQDRRTCTETKAIDTESQFQHQLPPQQSILAESETQLRLLIGGTLPTAATANAAATEPRF
jgi:hypothetical protein